MKQFELTDAEQRELDSNLLKSSGDPATPIVDEDADETWKYYVFAVPPTFTEILEETIRSYQLLYNTEKKFPALEAIVMEARNALPQEILDTLVVEGA